MYRNFEYYLNLKKNRMRELYEKKIFVERNCSVCIQVKLTRLIGFYVCVHLLKWPAFRCRVIYRCNLVSLSVWPWNGSIQVCFFLIIQCTYWIPSMYHLLIQCALQILNLSYKFTSEWLWLMTAYLKVVLCKAFYSHHTDRVSVLKERQLYYLTEAKVTKYVKIAICSTTGASN